MNSYEQEQKSISLEFLKKKDTLKKIINGNHNGEDGRFKEMILYDLIKKLLPEDVEIRYWFCEKR